MPTALTLAGLKSKREQIEAHIPQCKYLKLINQASTAVNKICSVLLLWQIFKLERPCLKWEVSASYECQTNVGAAGPANPCSALLSPPARCHALLPHTPILSPRSSCRLNSPLSRALEGHGLPRENGSTEETHPGLETGYRWWLRQGIPGSLKAETGLESRLHSKCARLYTNTKWAQLHGPSGSWSCWVVARGGRWQGWMRAGVSPPAL